MRGVAAHVVVTVASQGAAVGTGDRWPELCSSLVHLMLRGVVLCLKNSHPELLLPCDWKGLWEWVRGLVGGTETSALLVTSGKQTICTSEILRL